MTQTVLLGNEIEFAYGKGLPQRDRRKGKFPVYGSNGQVDFHDRPLVEGPGIIVGRKGSAGEVTWSFGDFWPIDTTYYVKLKNKDDSLKYWYYQLKTLGLTNLNSHSAIPGLNRDVAYAKHIIKRSPSEQKRIADILGTIDEKIELNRKMNEIFEQIGQALFRHYFIDNTLAGTWKDGRIIDIAEVTDYVANGSFASLKENVTLYDSEEFALFIRTTDYKNGFIRNQKYVDRKSYDFLKKSKLNGSEFIISNVGDVGTVFKAPVWLDKPMTLASNVIMVRDSRYNNYLYLYFRGDVGQFEISNITAGSAQPKFNKTEFRNLKIKIPDDATLHKFNLMYDLISEEIVNLNAGVQSLTTLHSTLLPRLISGNIII